MITLVTMRTTVPLTVSGVNQSVAEIKMSYPAAMIDG